MSKEIAVIILNWNAAADTIRCVRELTGWQRLRPQIWVIDNASVDGSADRIARECPQVRLIRNAVNLGYAGGNNRGLIEAVESDTPLLLLNNDATITEDDVICLYDSLQAEPQLGLVGPLLFDAEQKDRLLTAGGQNMVRHLTSHISLLNGSNAIRIVDYVPGTVLLGRAELFRTVGLLDEAYFFNGELPDLCHRARQQGFLSAVDTRARAYHTVNRSAKYRQTLYSYYIIRNRFLFIRKFYRFLFTPYVGFWTLYSLALSLKLYLNGEPQPARAVRMGLVDGLRGRFGGQNERVLAACANLDGLQEADLDPL